MGDCFDIPSPPMKKDFLKIQKLRKYFSNIIYNNIVGYNKNAIPKRGLLFVQMSFWIEQSRNSKYISL